MAFSIGSTVRIRDDTDKKHPFSCRATVATISGNNVSLVRDDLAPIPIDCVDNFIVAPNFDGAGNSVDEYETTVDTLMELLPFEDQCDHDEIANSSSLRMCKTRGDQLLRLYDYTCAVKYYEAALTYIASTSNITIGGTCIVKRNGDAVIAEVDCIDSDQYDVTFTGDEEEATISQKDILCSVWSDDSESLQPRCLLNLSRCLVKLAEIDKTNGNVRCVGVTKQATRQERYRSSAVLGCSITITLCEYLKESTGSPDIELLESLIGKARLIRSRAFLGRNLLRNAMVDAKKVAKQNPNDREATKLMADIKIKEHRNKLLDRKISKEVSRWVQKATTTSEGAAAIDRVDGKSSVSESESNQIETGDQLSFIAKMSKISLVEFGAVIAILIALLVIHY